MSIDEMSNDVVVQKPSLPAPGELNRNGHRKLSLTDLVEPIFESLYNRSDKFRAYLEAVENADAVEGVIKDDNTLAALMIREAAPDGPVKDAKIGQVRGTLGHVSKRFGIARTDRQREYLAAIEAVK